MSCEKIQIEDLELAPLFWLKQNAHLLEIANVYRPTRLGKRLIPLDEVKFKPFKNAKQEVKILEKLRDHSTGKVVDSRLGKVLLWDYYAIRLKK